MKRFANVFGLALCAALITSACGTVATPEFQVDQNATSVALAATDAFQTETAPTPVPATATLVPTNTPLPTNTPPPTATPAPTQPPTATTLPPTLTPTPVGGGAGDAPLGAAAAADEIRLALAAGDVTRGQAIFVAAYNTSSGPWQCSTCHSVDASQARLIGPGLWGLHARAAERAADAGNDGPVDYTVRSILYPNEYIVPPDASGNAYPAGLMPQNYEELFTEQELADVVAYILSLGNDAAQ